MVVGLKYCKKCDCILPVSKFWKNKTTKDGLQSWCNQCWKNLTNTRRNGPKREIELRQRKNRHLITKYGITIEEYETMFTDQEGACLICHTPQTNRPLNIDHDHSTGKIRGLLCENCNRGLGLFKDDPIRLLNAIKYLRVKKYGIQKHREKTRISEKLDSRASREIPKR